MKQSEAIKLARKKAGFSQKKLAEKTGLSIATIQGYEQEKYLPKIENLTKIADALNVPLSDLINSEALSLTDSILALFTNNLPRKIQLSPEEEALQANISAAFHTLNISGKRKLADYAQDLTELKKYKKKLKIQAIYRPNEAPPESAGSDASPPTSNQTAAGAPEDGDPAAEPNNDNSINPDKL